MDTDISINLPPEDDQPVPGPAETRKEPKDKKCPYCLGAIGESDATEKCTACNAVYHGDCWHENGGCAVYGCVLVPKIEARGTVEVPNAYWGQENKNCPACNQQILAAAIRCRHCGATFASARPQQSAEFQNREALSQRLPRARRRVIQLFVLSVIPVTAPIAAVWGALWRKSNREEIAALPAIHGALSLIGFFTSLVLTGALVLLTFIYALVLGS